MSFTVTIIDTDVIVGDDLTSWYPRCRLTADPAVDDDNTKHSTVVVVVEVDDCDPDDNSNNNDSTTVEIKKMMCLAETRTVAAVATFFVVFVMVLRFPVGSQESLSFSGGVFVCFFYDIDLKSLMLSSCACVGIRVCVYAYEGGRDLFKSIYLLRNNSRSEGMNESFGQ